MALETLSSPCNEFSNFIIYDTISATPFSSNHIDTTNESSFLENTMNYDHEQAHHEADAAIFDHSNCSMMNSRKRQSMEQEETMNNPQVVQRKKRRRKPRVCKNKEEAETQRITHITVERNRRKQMNEHLAVLRSLMPESYVQRVCFLSYCHIFYCTSFFCCWDFSQILNMLFPLIAKMGR